MGDTVSQMSARRVAGDPLAWRVVAAHVAALLLGAMLLLLSGCSSSRPVEDGGTTPAPVVDTSTASGLADAKFGTFKTIETSGSGDGYVDLPVAAGALVTVKCDGTGDFAMETVNADDEPTSLLVNFIGPYSGTTMYAQPSPPDKLHIASTGNWSVKVAPVSTAPTAAASIEGSGDAVLLYDGPMRTWGVIYRGKFPFVLSFSTIRQTLTLVDQPAGKVDGAVKGPSGPAVIVVSTHGPWSLKSR